MHYILSIIIRQKLHGKNSKLFLKSFLKHNISVKIQKQKVPAHKIFKKSMDLEG